MTALVEENFAQRAKTLFTGFVQSILYLIISAEVVCLAHINKELEARLADFAFFALKRHYEEQLVKIGDNFVSLIM